MGRCLTPTTEPAPSGTGQRHCVVILACRMDSFPPALPKVIASRTTRPFSYFGISVPMNLHRGLGGRGRPPWNSKCTASSLKDTRLCPSGRVPFAVSH